MTEISPSATTPAPESIQDLGQLPLHDPLLWKEPLPLRATFYPLGFAIEIATNVQAILDLAAESWGHFTPRRPGPPLQFRFTISDDGPSGCPPTPIMRARGHQLACIADAYNYYVTDLDRGICSAWISRATLDHPLYLRFHLIESAVFVLLSNTRATPIHGACVSLNGCGILLSGKPGAGKSTLAYACSRAGWTFTSDDASYLADGDEGAPLITANSHKIRFRPTAGALFPEIQGLSLTPRAAGKPSIEILTADLPNINTAEEVPVHNLIFLNRQTTSTAELMPLAREDAWPRLFDLIYPGDQQRQAAAIARLASVAIYEMRYSDLGQAIARLTQLTRETHPVR